MKRVKAIKHPPLKLSLLVAAMLMASAGAQASVTLTAGSGTLSVAGGSVDVIQNAGSISIRNPGVVLVTHGSPVATQTTFINPPAVSLNNASASSQVSGNMSYSVGSSSGNFSESDASPDGSAVALDLNRKGYGYHAEASATGTALKARAETDWVQNTDSNGYSFGYGNSSAYATSIWSDWFVISGGAGLGTASFTSLLGGNLVSAANGSANFGLNVSYSTGASCYYWYNTCTAADQHQTLISQTTTLSGRSRSTLSQAVEGEFTFAYDMPFQLTAVLNVGAANGGMADVSLASLNSSLVLPVGMSVQSASGLYVQAVPEAETYAMMLAGLGLVGVAAARRRSGE